MKLQVPSTQYIFPPRAKTCCPKNEAVIFLEMGWKPQLKYNDSHILIKLLPKSTNSQNIEIWNRHGEKLRDYTAQDWLLEQIEQVASDLWLSADAYHLLDGGLLDRKHRAIKDSIVIWDILVRDGEHLLGTTYAERYNSLCSKTTGETWWYTHPKHDPVDFGLKLSDNIFLVRQYEKEDWEMIWNVVELVNAPFTTVAGGTKAVSPVIEGVVLKDYSGRLEMGFRELNNDSWLAKSRIETKRHRF